MWGRTTPPGECGFDEAVSVGVGGRRKRPCVKELCVFIHCANKWILISRLF